MTKEQAIAELNKYRNKHYNNGVDDEARWTAQALDVILPDFVKKDELKNQQKLEEKNGN